MKKMMARTKKLLIAAAALLAVYSLAGFFLVPYLIETFVAGKLSEALKREVTISQASFNPYSFNLSVRGFKVMEADGSGVFASFEELKINLQGRSLVKGGLTVKQLVLDRPYVRAVHNRDLSYNFTDLISKGGPEKEAGAGKPLKFSFNNISIKNGSVDFVDLPKEKTHTLREMNVEIPFISSIPSEVGIFVKPSFSARFNGTLFAFEGESKPFADSFETSLDIKLSGLNMPEYLAYSPVPLRFMMPSGTLSADLALTYIQYKERPPVLALNGALEFKDIELQEKGGLRIARLPAVDVAISSADAFAGRARISSVSISRPDVSVVRKEDGTINMLALVPGKGEGAPGEEEKVKEQAAREGKKGPAFTVEVDRVAIEKARLSFTDLTRRMPFRRGLEPVDITLTGFTNAEGKPAALKLSYSGSGESMLVEGGLSVNPVKAELSLQANGIDIRPVQSYMDEVVNMTVARGKASASGTVAFANGQEGMSLSYRGGARLAGFSAVDWKNGELVGWDALDLAGMEFDLDPRRVVVGSVVLSDLRSNIVVNSDGVLNLVEAVSGGAPGLKAGQEAAPAEKASAPAGPPAYMRIDSVQLKGGRVEFKDMSIEPVFTSSVSGLNGWVKGLYLDGSRLAELAVTGRIDTHAPFEASGRINPKKDELLVDLRFKLDGFELSSVTPYSGRYIGYVIDKGKIFLDLDYLVEKRTLTAGNDVLIDQITLGKRVESPRATKLPVSFAISLLKDRSGQIKLDVPLSGSLDDPEFSVASIVIQIVFNLLEKAVTSPFALLGSMFGGGGDLGYVEFDPGSFLITDASAEKLSSLSTALFERPGLKLDVQGFVAVKEDSDAVSEAKFMRALKAEKLKELKVAGKTLASVDEVAIGKDEYEKFLWLAYKEADFPREKNFIGFVKKIPAPEMELLLRKHTRATEDDLRALAAGRSNAIRDHIVSTGKVEPARVFIRWPRELAPSGKEGVRDSRVEFALQ